MMLVEMTIYRVCLCFTMYHLLKSRCVAQVAGDANANGQVYPDQSLYAANSVPQMVKRINQVGALDLERLNSALHGPVGECRANMC